MEYKPQPDRYTNGMLYRRCGDSGIQLPVISLGFWHNFGNTDCYATGLELVEYAFDHGVCHFDLANNYGPPAGSAEENFGRMMKQSFAAHRDEMFITSKAGHEMWAGPYGQWGSRKHLMASIDQSLKRMGVEYVDIFYSHRPDPITPLEETMSALSDIVKQGKALYTGISKYDVPQTQKAAALLKEAGTPCLIHQDRYSLFDRHIEDGLLETIHDLHMGMIAFSPLAQGLLSNRYLQGISPDSRAAKSTGFLQKEQVTETVLHKVRHLSIIAQQRGQTLAEMALAWLLRNDRVTSVIIGVSSVDQLLNNLKAIANTEFSSSELESIRQIL